MWTVIVAKIIVCFRLRLEKLRNKNLLNTLFTSCSIVKLCDKVDYSNHLKRSAFLFTISKIFLLPQNEPVNLWATTKKIPVSEIKKVAEKKSKLRKVHLAWVHQKSLFSCVSKYPNMFSHTLWLHTNTDTYPKSQFQSPSILIFSLNFSTWFLFLNKKKSFYWYKRAKKKN